MLIQSMISGAIGKFYHKPGEVPDESLIIVFLFHKGSRIFSDFLTVFPASQ